ncbi:MAG: Gfo/Idh/MocA family oxidoreductase [Elusimicrobia bacterium]|nr:Gfo/Idh/MocA family oxidoreductase [Elusimicrobiota bacterium]
MINKNVIVIGYGSIGKRHVKNLLSLGIYPYVITAYPEKSDKIKFLGTIDDCKDADCGIICTPTANHLKDFKRLVEKAKCKSVLIEKPITDTIKDAMEIKSIAEKYGVEVFVAYNMRFIKAFELIKECISKYRKNIRMVKIYAGQYLPEWRPYKDYKLSYSSHRALGGGVDLDLSHEIDYMLWVFGFPKRVLCTMRKKISSLEIDSPDYFKGIYEYKGFISDVELDYIRKKDRKLIVLGENSNILDVDFIRKTIRIMEKDLSNSNLFDFEKGYIDEIKEFLGIVKKKNICGLNEAVDTMKLLGLEN